MKKKKKEKETNMKRNRIKKNEANLRRFGDWASGRTLRPHAKLDAYDFDGALCFLPRFNFQGREKACTSSTIGSSLRSRRSTCLANLRGGGGRNSMAVVVMCQLPLWEIQVLLGALCLNFDTGARTPLFRMERPIHVAPGEQIESG